MADQRTPFIMGTGPIVAGDAWDDDDRIVVQGPDKGARTLRPDQIPGTAGASVPDTPLEGDQLLARDAVTGETIRSEIGGFQRKWLGGIGEIVRTLLAKLSDQVTIKDFGAIGDGASHPLSERFATLGAAQTAYPNVAGLALTDQIDWAAINQALYQGMALVPYGEYVINKPMRFRTGSGLKGSQYRKCRIKLANGANCDMAILDDASAVDILLEHLTLFGNAANQTATSRGIYFNGGTDTTAHQAQAQYTADLPTFCSSSDAHRRLIDVLVMGCRNDGISLIGRGSNHCARAKAFANKGKGWFIDCYDSWFVDCDSGLSGLQGYHLPATVSALVMTGCKAWFAGAVTEASGYGFDIEGDGIRLIGCEAQDNANHGFRLASTASWNVLEGLVSEANGSLYPEFGVLVQNFQGLGSPPARTLTDVCGVWCEGASNRITGAARDRFATKRMDWACRFPGSAANNVIELVTGPLAQNATAGTLYNAANAYEGYLNNRIVINRQLIGRERFANSQANLGDFIVGSDSADLFRVGTTGSAIFLRGPSGGTAAQKNGVEIIVGTVLNTGQFVISTHNGTVATERLKIDFNGNIIVANLPTSASGLPTGALWVDTANGNVLKRV